MTIICINSTRTFQRQKWSSFRNMEDPNEAYNDFIEEYSTCFPLKVLKGKQVTKFFSPWLSPGLLKSVNKKNRLYRKFVTLSSTSSETKYKAYKNKLTHLIRIAKRKYYDSKFENARNDLKTTWKLLKAVINKRSDNIKKTNYVIFKPRPKKFNSSISLSFGGKPLQKSNVIKFPWILMIISPGNTISAMYVNKSLNQ